MFDLFLFYYKIGIEIYAFAILSLHLYYYKTK